MENKSKPPPQHAENKAIKILAKSVYRDLQAGGYGEGEIVRFASEVIELLTAHGADGEAG